MMLISRMPERERYSVRGMGVADSASVSTVARNWRSLSLCLTPNRCSSSMMISPRSAKPMSFDSRRWVADGDIDIAFLQVLDGALDLRIRTEP